MLPNKYRHNPGVKIIAIGVACLLFINSAIFADINSSTLSPKSPFIDGKDSTEIQASLICELIEKRAKYENPLDGLYLDDLLIWKNSSERVFEGCRFEALPGEIRIYLPKSSTYIRYYDSTDSKKAKTLPPNTDWTKVKRNVVSKCVNRQIIHISKALPFRIDESKGSKLGSATIAKRLMNEMLGEYDYIEEDINVMVTYKCPYDCKDCLASDAKRCGRARDVSKYKLYSIFDQLKGFNRIHIVGTGEPLAYGKRKLYEGGISQDFLDIVWYAAALIKEVRIVTNAYLVPTDIKEAEKFFSQFPKNVVWLVSVDKWHEREMLKRSHKSLRKVVKVMEELASRGAIKTAYNIRMQSDFEAHKVLKHFGLLEKINRSRDSIFINGLLYQGNARRNDIEGAEHLNPQDIVDHARQSRHFFPFIDPEGYLVSSDHIAYMTEAQRREFGKDYDKIVLGNIEETSLADIIIDKLLCSNYLHELVNPLCFVMPRQIEQHDRNEDVRTLMNQINIGGHTMRDILRIVVKAILLHSKGYVEDAKLLIASLDIDEEGLEEEVVERLRWRLYDTMLNISYHLFTHVEGVDIKSFMIDCLGNKIFHTELGEFRPDIEAALEVLSLGSITRGQFQNSYYCKWYEIPKWIKNPDSNSSVHIPVYTTKNYRKKYQKDRSSLHENQYGDCYFPGMNSPHDKLIIYEKGDKEDFIQRYLRTYELAKLGLMPIPLGILRDSITGEDFYIEEDFEYSQHIGSVIKNWAKGEKINFTALKRYVKSIGRFAARVDNAGLKFKPKVKDVIRQLNDRYLLWVITSLDVLSEKSDAISAKEAVLYMLSEILNEMDSKEKGYPDIYGKHDKIKAEKRNRIVKESFNEGYNSARKAEKTGKKPRLAKTKKVKTAYKITDAYSRFIENISTLTSTILADSKDDVLLRVPVETIEYIGEGDVKVKEKIREFLKAFENNPHGHVELFHMTGTEKSKKASPTVHRHYGLNKPLPRGFTPSRRNTVTLFPVLKGEISPEEAQAKKDINRLLAERLGPKSYKETQVIPIGIQHDSAFLARGALTGISMIHIARYKEGHEGRLDTEFIKKFVEPTVKFYKNLSKSHGIKDFNLTTQDIINIATGQYNDFVEALNKLIKLLPITPIDLEELRQIFEHAADKFA